MTDIILETPRLLLHGITPEQYDHLFRSRSEEELRSFFGTVSEADWEKERTKHREGMVSYGKTFRTFLLQEKNGGQTIGSCGFHTWYHPHRRAEIGYALYHPELMGRGLMKEALTAVVRHGFGPMNLNRIEAFTSRENIASQRLLLGMGFREEGVMRGHYCKNGNIEDSVIFGLLQHEFDLKNNEG